LLTYLLTYDDHPPPANREFHCSGSLCQMQVSTVATDRRTDRRTCHSLKPVPTTRGGHKPSRIRTRFLMPLCWRMARRARLNRAMLAMVSAERQRSSAFASLRILTIVLKPPRSVMARRINAFVVISFMIFNAPICSTWLEIQESNEFITRKRPDNGIRGADADRL